MNKRSPHKLVSVDLWVVLTVVFLAALSLPTPQSSAQQDNRQLSRNQAQQSNRASERRIALVIGNGAYTNAPPLKNPPNYAREMAAALRSVGFEVSSKVDAGQREMKQLIREFGQKRKGGTAIPS